MKQYKSFILTAMLGCSLIGLGLSSCSDDLGVKSDNLDTPTGIVLRIPNIDASATRAEMLPTDKEGEFESMYLYVFKENGSSYYFLDSFEITDKLTKSLSGDYQEYQLSLAEGRYKFYLLANVDKYSDANTVKNLNTEAGIKALNLSFSALPEAGKLPMACLSYIGEQENNMAPDNYITITSSDATKGKAIYADLSFLVSKVRYTVLFDNTDENLSKKFGTKVADFNPSVAVANILKSTPMDPSKTAGSDAGLTTGTSSLAKYAWPFNGNYSANSPISDFTGAKSAWAASDNQKRAWQGVVYLPENTTDKPSSLTLTGACYDGTTKVYDITKAISLLPQAVEGSKALKRGNMYDIVLSVKNYDALDITSMNVTTWNTQTLSYILNGKPYELIVDQTVLNAVGTTEEVILNYSSDVTVSVESPVLGEGFTKKGTPFYQLTLDAAKNQIKVKINSSIPFSDLQKITGDVEKNYNFFHVKAGNLKKKIDVANLIKDPVFEVTPESIILDVREMISSGENAPEFKIHYVTNIDNATISIVDGANTNILSSLVGKGAGEVLTLKHEGGSNITTTNLGKIEGDLILTANQIMNGNPYWKTSPEYNLTFNCTSAGVTVNPQKVKITVKPYTSDYIIHFKDSQHSWGAPHIYVYQCLELPTQVANYGGQTVGYCDGDSDKDNSYFAALEYAFTNDLSFNGWAGYGGTVATTMSNTTKERGFVILGGINKDENLKFKPGNLSSSIYNFNSPHNEAHKANLNKNSNGWICLACEEDKYNLPKGGRTYPGIVMEYEGEGWWKYTLTGVATPGKAMIMFSDGHSGEVEDSNYRYPNHSKVGVPLFDFPDNEGWFLYGGEVDGNYSFVDDKPQNSGSTGKENYYNYRFYWPGGFEREYAFFQWSKGVKTGNTAGWGRIGLTQGNWDYYEFGFRSQGSNDFSYSVGWNHDDQHNSLTGGIHIVGSLSSFKQESDGWYYGYITEQNNTIQGGNPSGTSPGTTPGTSKTRFEQGDQIKIKWYRSTYGGSQNYKYIYFYPEDCFQVQKGWPGYQENDGTVQKIDDYTFEITVTAAKAMDDFNVIIHNNVGEGKDGDERRDQKITFDASKYKDGVYVYENPFWD